MHFTVTLAGRFPPTLIQCQYMLRRPHSRKSPTGTYCERYNSSDDEGMVTLSHVPRLKLPGGGNNPISQIFLWENCVLHAKSSHTSESWTEGETNVYHHPVSMTTSTKSMYLFGEQYKERTSFTSSYSFPWLRICMQLATIDFGNSSKLPSLQHQSHPPCCCWLGAKADQIGGASRLECSSMRGQAGKNKYGEQISGLLVGAHSRKYRWLVILSLPQCPLFHYNGYQIPSKCNMIASHSPSAAFGKTSVVDWLLKDIECWCT